MTFWERVAARNSVFYNTKSSPRSDRECPVRDDDFMLGSWSDDPRIVFLLAEALQGVSAEILSFKISWQAQYLVKLEAASCCSARIVNDVSYYVTRIHDE